MNDIMHNCKFCNGAKNIEKFRIDDSKWDIMSNVYK